jgi:DNA-binding transcriptional ArsR family regulator
MVKSSASLDKLFHALSDPTRRDIVRRVSLKPLTVNEIASAYSVSLPAISKHLKRLEDAKLIIRKRQGLGFLIEASPDAMRQGRDFFIDHESNWMNRLQSMRKMIDNDK